MDEEAAVPLFRARKRRKVTRRPLSDDETKPALHTSDSASSIPDTPSTNAPPALPAGVAEDEEDEGDHQGLSVAEILRRRKAAKARHVGIHFSTTTNGKSTKDGEDSRVPVPASSAVEAAMSRFVPQTGQVADILDKHMMAYIDSKMAELRSGIAGSDASASTELTSNDKHESSKTGGLQGERQPAGIGKIQEVDLGPDATLRNIALTAEATKKLQGVDTDNSITDKGKVRLGPDGNPWRNKRGRNSEDIKRDKLVEEVLRESKLELYEEPSESSEDDGEAADDRIAEQFRREFMDAIQSRNAKKTQTGAAGAKGRTDPTQTKGPKLGGSRSARAAMRAMEEKGAKKR